MQNTSEYMCSMVPSIELNCVDTSCCRTVKESEWCVACVLDGRTDYNGGYLRDDVTLSWPLHQVDPQKYKNMFHGFRVTAQEEGFRALGKGWAPTLIGYSMQGLCKFGFYEVFKIFYSNLLGEVRFAVCLL